MPKIPQRWFKEAEINGKPGPAVETGPARTEQLAICLFDIDRVDPFIRETLIAGKLEAKALRMDEHRPDETAVMFICSLLDAAVTCDILRNHDRQVGDNPTRVWLKKSCDHSWVKQTGNAVFTVIEGEKLKLHPWVFPPPAARVEAVGLKAEKMF